MFLPITNGTEGKQSKESKSRTGKHFNLPSWETLATVTDFASCNFSPEVVILKSMLGLLV